MKGAGKVVESVRQYIGDRWASPLARDHEGKQVVLLGVQNELLGKMSVGQFVGA